jgi:ubiquitin-conjugating enzyme E2 A
MSRADRLSRRLLKEFKKITADRNNAFTAGIDQEDITKWTATIFGPEGTEWDGGVFRLTVCFPDDYPIHAPDVRFLPPYPFHPNIYANGKICIDILQHNWSAAYELASVLTSVQALLIDPNPQSPANNEAAVLFSDNRAEYNRRVRHCVESTWASTA